MFPKEKFWHRLFEAGVLLKAINGLWETLSGCALLFVTNTAINKGFIMLAGKEFAEDPQDKFIHFLNFQLQHISVSTKDFAAIYILAHGIVNIFLAINLYKNRVWAYLVSIIFTGLVVLYLIYRASNTHSLVLTGVIIFDILFTILTLHEYKYRKSLFNP